MQPRLQGSKHSKNVTVTRDKQQQGKGKGSHSERYKVPRDSQKKSGESTGTAVTKVTAHSRPPAHPPSGPGSDRRLKTELAVYIIELTN